jgi:glycosyltransferase involved in cell wall biosynthesis
MLNSQPKYRISVLIPTFNNSQMLRKQLKIFFKQANKIKTPNFFEIIISDNGSKDDTKKIVKYFLKKNYSSKSFIIKYFRNKKNLGFNKNLFRTITLATGKYLFFLMDDDFPNEYLYENLYSTFLNKDFKQLCYFPVTSARIYKKNYLGFNLFAYIFNRATITSGILLEKSRLDLKGTKSNQLYPQAIFFSKYFLKNGIKFFNKKNIITIGGNSDISHKIYDKMNRKEDYATLEKFEAAEYFYNKTNLLEFIILICTISIWSIDIKYLINKAGKVSYEKKYYSKIILYKRSYILLMTLFWLLYKNLFKKKMIFIMRSIFQFFYEKLKLIKL